MYFITSLNIYKIWLKINKYRMVEFFNGSSLNDQQKFSVVTLVGIEY